MGKERRAQEREFDFNSREAQKQRDWESSEAQLSRNFNAGEAELARRFQDAQRLASQQYQSSQWQHQFNEELQHRFDVPQGINRAVYFSGHGAAAGVGGSVSAPSSGSAPVASSNPPSGGAAARSGNQIVSNIPQMLGALGGILNSLGSFTADTAQAKEVKTLLEGKLQGLVLDNVQKGLVNDYQRLNNDVLSKVKDVKVKQAFEAYANAVADTYMKRASGDKSVSDSMVNYSQMKLNDSLANLKGTEQALLKLEIGAFAKKLDSLLKTQASERARNYASAQESASSAKFTDVQRFITQNVQSAIEEKHWAELENLQKNGKIMDWQIDAAKSAAEIAAVNASHAESLFWKDFIMDIFSSGADAFLGYKNMKSWERLSKSAQENTARKIEQMKWEYGDKVQLEDKMPSGVKRTRTYRRPYSKYGDASY